jgi:hypothetical protein
MGINRQNFLVLLVDIPDSAFIFAPRWGRKNPTTRKERKPGAAKGGIIPHWKRRSPEKRAEVVFP